ncbi:MAG TPA: MATE family efflux transporter [Steroidobacteraceae bacterium]|nr:MATE family efflux transporter [Steroidobacteraceae bacterium]
MPFPSSQYLRSDARKILTLGAPLIANNLATSGMAFADTVMAGQLGARELAGLAVGVGYYMLCFLFGMGALMSISPCVAHAYGAGDDESVTRYLRQSLWIVLGISALVVFALHQSAALFECFDIEAGIRPIAIGYAEAVSWGIPPFFGFLALRYTSEGLGITRPIMFIAFLGLAVNVLGNWLLIYGHWDLPKMGAIGCAVATAIAQWLMFFAMLFYMRRHAAYKEYGFFRRIDQPQFDVIKQLLSIGLPIAGCLTAEGGLFVVAAWLMGSMSATIAAAHQIALNYASLMFMIPLAMNSATTIHVGHALGRGDKEAARISGWVGISMCGMVMFVSALFIVVFNDQIAAMYTSDLPVRELAMTLLLMAAIFQVSDGMQVGAAGALRGFKDTNVPLAITLFAYWLVGFPVAYYFGVYRNGGPVYVWAGLIAGLTVAAMLLNLRYRAISKRQ